MRYRESLVKTIRSGCRLPESPRTASMTERSAIRLLVVSGSETQ